MIRRLKPFEDDHLSRDDLRAMALHAPDRSLLVFRMARAEGVAHHVGLSGRLQQAEHRLLDANMGLAPRDDGMRVSRHAIQKTVFPAGVEKLLVDQAIFLEGHVLDGRPQALRVLFGEQARDAE